MRTLNKNELTPLQRRAFEVMKKQAENHVAYFGYQSLADALKTRRKKIDKGTARRLLQYLSKKEYIAFTPGKSYQKGEVVFLK